MRLHSLKRFKEEKGLLVHSHVTRSTEGKRNLFASFLRLFAGWLVVLAVVFVFNQGRQAPIFRKSRRVFPPATETDYFLIRPDGRGGTVRVMLAALSTTITPVTCYALASAYFSGLPFVVLGYNEKYTAFLQKQSTYEMVLDQAELRDEDVFIAFDADVLFTGQDVLPYIDHFIQSSPASAAEIDVRAIRAGRAAAPVTYYAEAICWASQTVHREKSRCKEIFTELDDLIERFARVYNVTYTPEGWERYNALRFPNPGAALHRVWALRELNEGIKRYMQMNAPLDGREWWCDQSLQIALFNDLRLWEINKNVFDDKEAWKRTNTYGLHPGLISLDYAAQFAASVPEDQVEHFELTSELWRYKDDNDNYIYSSMPDEYIPRYVDTLFNATKSRLQYTKRYLNHSIDSPIAIDIAPPLLSLKPRRLYGEKVSPVRVYPYVLHFSNPNKLARMRDTLVYTPWYVPMRYDKDKWQEGRKYLLNMPVELWSYTDKTRGSYEELCRVHPFS